MSTLKQSAASRTNGVNSHGPSSAAGKQRSSKNALTHGLSTRDLFVPPEELEEFNAMLASFHATLLPQGPIEDELFSHLVHDAWTVRRSRRLLASLPSPESAIAERYMHYYYRAERSFNRLLRRFENRRNEPKPQTQSAIVQNEANPELLPDQPFPQIRLNEPTLPQVLPNELLPPSKTPRNARCPCGSRLKFKRCCGKFPLTATRAA